MSLTTQQLADVAKYENERSLEPCQHGGPCCERHRVAAAVAHLIIEQLLAKNAALEEQLEELMKLTPSLTVLSVHRFVSEPAPGEPSIVTTRTQTRK
jgi:hypothetical protein